ncbi:MAG: mevalonate kinase [Methanomassiliicoccales archaeon]|nr:mevalonate kinase [Methanomassiliicoccales archaeon]
MVITSAPGKVILLGEHAVVFGQPAIAVAVDLRLRCHVHRCGSFTMNGAPLSPKLHPYIHSAIASNWSSEPLCIETHSDIPSGSGMGSSAAISTSLLAALKVLKGGRVVEEEVARDAFEVESSVQGRASPIDTSTSSHGQGVFVDSRAGDRLLWHLQKDIREWYIHDCQVPRMSLVVGYTGIHAATGPLVAKVKRFSDRTVFARDIIEEIGGIVREGMTCLKANDLEALGRLMTRDHKLLAILGVSHPSLNKLVKAALPYSYGAKLTGAGGGGSMIALTDRPDAVSEAIRIKGGMPIKVVTGEAGVRLEDMK